VIEVLVEVVRDAAKVPGQVRGAPLRAGGRGRPRVAGELGGQFTDDGHAIVIRGKRRARYPIGHGLPPRSVPAAPRAGLASVPESPSLRPPRSGQGSATKPPVPPRSAPNRAGGMLAHRPPRSGNPDDIRVSARLAS